jgi:hypothetical protein
MTTPDASELWLDPVFDAVVSDVQASGYFKRVNQHEPKRKPQTDLTAAVWVADIEPISGAAGSGLANTSARVIFTVRIYSNMLKEPQDMIDPQLMRAVSSIMRRYHDDFDFGLTDLVRNVDLLGMFGVKLKAITGYLEQDGTMFRIADITVPVIVNDVWPQVN